jgi:hypothetical protein
MATGLPESLHYGEVKAFSFGRTGKNDAVLSHEVSVESVTVSLHRPKQLAVHLFVLQLQASRKSPPHSSATFEIDKNRSFLTLTV